MIKNKKRRTQSVCVCWDEIEEALIAIRADIFAKTGGVQVELRADQTCQRFFCRPAIKFNSESATKPPIPAALKASLPLHLKVHLLCKSEIDQDKIRAVGIG